MVTLENPSDDLLDKVIDILRQCARLLTSGETIAPERPLTDIGIDSFALVELIAMLEDELGLTFEDEQLTPEMFESAKSIAGALAAIVVED